MALRLSRLGLTSPGSFRRGVAVLTGGAVLSQLAILAASPIVTRLYTPPAFGAFGIYLALLVIFVSVAALRYELAVPLPDDDTVAFNLLVVNVVALFATAAATAIFVALAGGWLVGETHTPGLEPFLWLLPVGVFAGGLYQSLSYWAIRGREFGSIARTRIAQGIGQALTQVVVGVFRSDPLGLILGSVIGRAAGTTRFLSLTWRGRPRTARALDVSEIRWAARRFARFPLISTWSAVLNSAGLQAPVLLLGAYYGASVVGWFALTQRVIGIPMVLLGSAVAQAFFGEASLLARTDPVRLESLFVRAARNLALLGVVPFLVLIIAGPWLFQHIFGEDWTEAGSYSRVLAPMFFAQLVTGPLAQTLNIFERLGVQLSYDFTRLTLGLGVISAAHYADLSPLAAIAMFAGTMTLMYAANFGLGLHEIRRTKLNGISP